MAKKIAGKKADVKQVSKTDGKKTARLLKKETKRVMRIDRRLAKLDKRIAALMAKKVRLEKKRDVGK